MAGYVWYGRNREGSRRANGVEGLVNMSLESRVSMCTKGVGVGGV